MITSKFSIGFRSGKLPGQSSKVNFDFQKNVCIFFFWSAAWCIVLLKNTIAIWEWFLHCCNQVFSKIFRYLVEFFIPSLGHNLPVPLRVKQPQNIFFGGCFGNYRIWKFLRGSPILRLTLWNLRPCTLKWLSSEKKLFTIHLFLYFYPNLGVFSS